MILLSALAEIPTGWRSWWLPPVRSVHGAAIDSLFYWIFWITLLVFLLVQGVLIVFLIKYRRRPDVKKAHYTHGNTRLELIWTIVPTIILAVMALGSKGLWDRYRYSPISEDPSRAKVLVIGQQFKWNVVYPGADGKFGRYLIYPKPTDPSWPVDKTGKVTSYSNVPGPAFLPYNKAMVAISNYIDSVNPLGKDFADPDGQDDNYEGALGRPVMVPVNRPIEVQLRSKDVIHDFFLPNFRVKLDAVPGLLGKVYFQATMTSAENRAASARVIKLDDLESVLSAPSAKDLVIQIDEKSPGNDQNKNKDARGWRYVNPATPRSSIIRSGAGFQIDPKDRHTQIEALRTIGLTEVLLSESGAWEVVCEEFCGQGHNTMTASLIVVSQEEYDAKKWDVPPIAATTLPSTTQATR